MPLTRSGYDGHADWYEGWNQPHVERNAANVLDLLGPGDGAALPFADGTFPAVRHPLAELLSAFIDAGLTIEQVAEFGDRQVPVILAIRARKRTPAERLGVTA